MFYGAVHREDAALTFAAGWRIRTTNGSKKIHPQLMLQAAGQEILQTHFI